MDCYIKTKEAITTNQTKDEVCVLNYEDEVLRAFGESAPVHVVWFNHKFRQLKSDSTLQS
jgi:UDP-N-acetylmuramoylalanine--D-glutamate ligase